MKRPLGVFAVMLAVLFYSQGPVSAYVGMYQHIEITGSERFVSRVKGALQLIEEKSPGAWQVVALHVRKIEEGDKTGMFPYLPLSPAVIGTRTFLCSVAWCAGAIVHNAYHAKLYEEYKKEHGASVPDDAWSGPEAEKKCLDFQIMTMREVGAPVYEREYLSSFDVVHNEKRCPQECPHG
jgi:hypothetical protein